MITPKEVEHIAHLARIELTGAEKEKFGKELSAILEFVEKLKEVNTEGVEALAGGTTLENALRSDEQIEKNLEGRAAELLEAVPERKEGWVKVRAVFEYGP